MPQLFQVLKCFKCSVFQVHQTKKSNKWECKLCGEKQSIKRHYGLGTGKECRLHVQKLNSIRGEVDEINETSKQYETSDEENLEKGEMKVPDKKQENVESKWSEYMDQTEEMKVPKPNESMFLENVEVVLEVPAKRQKFTKAKVNKNATVSIKYPSKAEDIINFANVRGSPSPPPVKFYETQISFDQKDLSGPSFVKMNDNLSAKAEIDIGECKKLPAVKTFVAHKIEKNSKWAQFADESDEENCGNDLTILNNRTDNNNLALNKDLEICNVQNDTDLNYGAGVPKNTVDLGICNGERNIKNTDVSKNIFSLCDENDLDDVLDF